MRVGFENLPFIRRRFIMAQLLGLFGFILIAGFEARAETVQGTYQYRRHDGSHRPIRYAKIEVWRFFPRALGVSWWAKDADATTDPTGKFSVNLPFASQGALCAVRVYAGTYGAVVWEKDTINTQFFREPIDPATGGPLHKVVNSADDILNFDFSFDDEASSIHYNLAEISRHGYDYANSHRDYREGDQIGQVNIQPQSGPPTYYNPVNDTIYIDTAHQFQDIGLLHEYGHHLENALSYFFAMPSEHDGCSAMVAGVLVNSAEHAWMEGFADYFAQVVARGLPPGTVQGEGGTFSVADLERPPQCNVATADKIELDVAGTLWDLFDGPNSQEPGDFINGQDRKVFEIFDHELNHLNRAPTIWDFSNAWVGRQLDAAGL